MYKNFISTYFVDTHVLQVFEIQDQNAIEIPQDHHSLTFLRQP